MHIWIQFVILSVSLLFFQLSIQLFLKFFVVISNRKLKSPMSLSVPILRKKYKLEKNLICNYSLLRIMTDPDKDLYFLISYISQESFVASN